MSSLEGSAVSTVTANSAGFEEIAELRTAFQAAASSKAKAEAAHEAAQSSLSEGLKGLQDLGYSSVDEALTAAHSLRQKVAGSVEEIRRLLKAAGESSGGGV